MRKAQIVYLDPDPERLLEPERNSRRDTSVGSAASSPADAPSLEELAANMRSVGMLEIPTVDLLADGRHRLRYGSRRRKAWMLAFPGEPMPCVLAGGAAIEPDAAFVELLRNLSENLHRRDLQPWELAETIFDLKQLRPGLTPEQLAGHVAVSRSYAQNLLTIRTRAHPHIWEQFRLWGTTLSIGYHELVRIVSKQRPQDEQLAEWSDVIARKRSALYGGRRGAQRRPGPAKLLRYLQELERVFPDRPRSFFEGAQFMGNVALGKARWPK